MSDNAPSFATIVPTSFVDSQAFVGEILMTWPSYPLDLSPIEHLRSRLKQGFYKGGEQFS